MSALLSRPAATAPATKVAAFDAWLDKQAEPRLFELVDGAVVMIANPTETHNQIASNLHLWLKLAADAHGCRAYMSDMRVQRSDSLDEINKSRPDVVVRCGPNTGKTFVTDPVIVVEVLSPSTMDIDRGLKPDFYKSLPTLQHIVLAYQDQMRVERYRRDGDTWVTDVWHQRSDVLAMPAYGVETTLDAVYFGLDV